MRTLIVAGEKIVVITNLVNPKPMAENRSTLQHCTVNGGGCTVQPGQKINAQSHGDNDAKAAAQEQDEAIKMILPSESADVHAPDPSSAVSRMTETIDEGCVITLIEDGNADECENTTSGHHSGARGLVSYVAVVESKSVDTAKRKVKRKSLYNSPDLVNHPVETYLPPRKSCIDKREKKSTNAPKSKRRRSRNSTPVQDEMQDQQFANTCPFPMQDQSHFFPEDAQNRYGNVVYMQAFPNTSCGPDGSNRAVPVGPIVANQEAQAMSLDGSFLCSPQNNRNLSQFIACTTENNQETNNGIVGQQAIPQINEQNFTPYNAPSQRGLHTPIFDDIGNTPLKEYPGQHSGHLQMNDPVLIETAGKRMTALPVSHDLTSDESSRDSHGSNILDGIHVLASPTGRKRSPLIQNVSSSNLPRNSTDGDHNAPSTITKGNYSVQDTADPGVAFECFFTGENLTRQVQAVVANKRDVLGEFSLEQDKNLV